MNEDERGYLVAGLTTLFGLVTLIILGIMLSGCASLPQVKPQSDPWPKKEDGTPYARCFEHPAKGMETSCCATEGPIVLEPWPRQTWTVYTCPADEPEDPPPGDDDADEPPPDPDEPPADDPPGEEPPGDGDEEPEPVVGYPGPWRYAYTDCEPHRQARGECVPRAPRPDLYGAELQRAADEALEIALAEGWARDEGHSPAHVGGMRRGSIPEDAAVFVRWADLVASRVRPPYVAYRAGGAREEVGIAHSDGVAADPACLGLRTTRENHDMAQSGAPGGRAWIGGSQFHLAARGFAPGTDCLASDGPGPDLGSGGPADESGYCTVAGHGNADGPLRFPTMLAACQFRMNHDARPGGHIERHEIGGETWFHDAGRGWYRYATCERWSAPESRGGRRLSGPDWFGVRCRP